MLTYSEGWFNCVRVKYVQRSLLMECTVMTKNQLVDPNTVIVLQTCIPTTINANESVFAKLELLQG